MQLDMKAKILIGKLVGETLDVHSLTSRIVTVVADDTRWTAYGTKLVAYGHNEVELIHPQPGDRVRVTFETTVDQHCGWLFAHSEKHENLTWEIVAENEPRLPQCHRCHITILESEAKWQRIVNSLPVFLHDNEICDRNLNALRDRSDDA